MKNENERIVFVDYIRVVACFLVMLVHASENFYAADASGLAGNVSMLLNESNRFWVAFYDGGVARTCVPLFMVVSAFLLVPLKPGTTMGAFYRKRFTRILPPMLFFMLVYTFLPLLWGGITCEQSLKDLARLPFNFPSMAGHLWFMYPLISLYIIIPVVSPWLERASANDERLFDPAALASPLRQQRVVGRMFLERFYDAVVLFGLSGLSGSGTLYPRSPRLESLQTPSHRHNLLCGRCSIHCLVVLGDGYSGPFD